MDFRLTIPDPLADERRLLGHSLANAYQSVMYDMTERFPEPELKQVIQDCVEAAMVETLQVFDGKPGLQFGSLGYVILPANMVECMDRDTYEMPNLAGSLSVVLKHDFGRINS